MNKKQMLAQEQQILEQIKKAENILVTFRKTWNGDSVASALAIFLYLKKIGKNAELVSEPSERAKLFSFLPGANEIKTSLENLRQFIISLDITNTKVSQIKYKIKENALNFIISPKEGFFTHEDIESRSGGFKYDLIIVVDTPDFESLGKIYDNDTEFFYNTPIINIDHHPENENFGQINFVDINSVSTSEQIHKILEADGASAIDEDIATCLLAGMISKTKSFKTPNVTPKSLSAAADLIALGARREEIVNHFYRSRPLNVLKLWGVVLARLQSSLDNKLVWAKLLAEDFAKTKTDENDLSDVVSELIINIPQSRVIVLFYENQAGTCALIHSSRNINSLELVQEYNPSGTRDLAKAEIKKPLKEAEGEVIKTIEEKMKRLPL